MLFNYVFSSRNENLLVIIQYNIVLYLIGNLENYKLNFILLIVYGKNSVQLTIL